MPCILYSVYCRDSEARVPGAILNTATGKRSLSMFLIGHPSPGSFPFKCDLPAHWSDPSVVEH